MSRAIFYGSAIAGSETNSRMLLGSAKRNSFQCGAHVHNVHASRRKWRVRTISSDKKHGVYTSILFVSLSLSFSSLTHTHICTHSSSLTLSLFLSPVTECCFSFKTLNIFPLERVFIAWRHKGNIFTHLPSFNVAEFFFFNVKNKFISFKTSRN